MTAGEMRMQAKYAAPFTEIRTVAKAYAALVKAGTITEKPNPADRRQRLSEDKRTMIQEFDDNLEFPVVIPFYVTAKSVYIVCPYCGEIHHHGRGVRDYVGFRQAHCLDIGLRKDESPAEYFIEQIPKSETK